VSNAIRRIPGRLGLRFRGEHQGPFGAKILFPNEPWYHVPLSGHWSAVKTICRPSSAVLRKKARISSNQCQCVTG